MHILDIVQNSISADASDIKIIIDENIKNNILEIKIIDDGRGMAKEETNLALDPFVTSRNTREVGLGLPLFAEAAESCNGQLKIESSPGKGTKIEAQFEYDHIDRAPLGDITETIISIISVNPELDLEYIHYVNNNKFYFSTLEIKKELDSVKINQTKILTWIRNYINEGIDELNGGE